MIILSPHLKKAVKKEIISEVDASIIACLIEIFNKIFYFDLRDIFREYKGSLSDETVYSLLLKWFEEGNIPDKILVKLGDIEIPIRYIQTIRLVDSYDSNKQCPIYKVIINQDESDKLLFSNTEIDFYSKKKREKELVEFKEKTKYLGIKYI